MAPAKAKTDISMSASIRGRVAYYLPTISVAVAVILLWEFIVIIFDIKTIFSCRSPQQFSPSTCTRSICG